MMKVFVKHDADINDQALAKLLSLRKEILKNKYFAKLLHNDEVENIYLRKEVNIMDQVPANIDNNVVNDFLIQLETCVPPINVGRSIVKSNFALNN
ncbi:CLUMA_CG013954, isoform A [Clunio marinus]|uniref:CLUMA_CG013954, isoform A n=1 Tax=Clunio marinus TaxID=568069 RepID=A0A1J1IKD4_9DIPT|nr:CLUMA_CG013954, isoform A [Clunio marinus]